MCQYEERYTRVHGGSVLILGTWAVESAALACVRRPLVGYSRRYPHNAHVPTQRTVVQYHGVASYHVDKSIKS
jgi:hypothetical protein